MRDGLADWLFDPAGLTPHGFCLLWDPGLIATYAAADIGIGVAYFTIPIILAIFARRRRDLVFRPLFWLFAAFILLCGATHWLDVLTLWVPAYRLQVLVKLATAAVSLVTAVALWHLMPKALALPSSAQLRAANQALLESQARHRASFEQSPVPLYTVDMDDTIVAVSESWLSLLGYAEQEVIGRPIDTFRSPDSNCLADDQRAKLMGQGQLLDQERRFLRRDGTIVEALVSARVDRRGDRVAIICVLIDVTARRQAEAALRASAEHLRHSQKMEAMGQLTGGIAHDFNNILQGISGCLDLLDQRIGEGRPEDAGRYIGSARRSVDRAATLAHRMLAFARRQALQPRPVELDSLLADMEPFLRSSVGSVIRIALNRHEGVGQALCDPGQLEDALLNLALNARDAMPDGGTLTIAARDRHLAAADIAGEDGPAPGDYVEIAVSDTGTGIDPAILPRVCDPFFTTKPIGSGTGLGLSQVYGFVRQSGGMVRLASTLGQGTTVSLLLPRSGPADAAAAQPARQGAPAEAAPHAG